MVDLSCLRPAAKTRTPTHPLRRAFFLSALKSDDVRCSKKRCNDEVNGVVPACQASCLCGSTHHGTGTQ